METTKKISSSPYLFVGIVFGVVLSLTYLRWMDYSFIHYAISFYGVFYLCAMAYTSNHKTLWYTTLLPALLASLPFGFHEVQHAFSAIVLAVINAYMLNSFHLNYLTHRWKLHYPTLFYTVWDSFVRFCAVALFTLFCWLILLLTAALFGLLKITFLQIWVDNTAFDILCLSIFASIGFYLAAKTQPVLQQLRTIFLMLCRTLFAPLSIIGILFVFATAVTLALHKHITIDPFVFLAFAFLGVVFINALHQDGKHATKHPLLLMVCYRIFLMLSPIFTVFALYGLFFRGENNIIANGLNVDNFPYFLNTLFLLCYTITYAFLAFRARTTWQQGMERANIVLACIVILVTLLTLNPLFTMVFPETGMQVVSVVM